MSDQQYFASHEREGTELERLRLVEQFGDPTTIRHLQSIGVLQGWKCLEVGAGAGSVAHWLCACVGSSGKVVATDIDTRFLSQVNAPNLEIRQHDITKDELELGFFDLVHCRLLLEHLANPEEGLRRMSEAVRPGGWLVIEEADFGSELSADVTNPTAAVFTSTLRTAHEFLLKKHVVDPYLGRRVRGFLEQLGYTDIGHEGWSRIVRGGEPYAQLLGNYCTGSR